MYDERCLVNLEFIVEWCLNHYVSKNVKINQDAGEKNFQTQQQASGNLRMLTSFILCQFLKFQQISELPFDSHIAKILVADKHYNISCLQTSYTRFYYWRDQEEAAQCDLHL